MEVILSFPLNRALLFKESYAGELGQIPTCFGHIGLLVMWTCIRILLLTCT
jgi:hypothetical protein